MIVIYHFIVYLLFQSYFKVIMSSLLNNSVFNFFCNLGWNDQSNNRRAYRHCMLLEFHNCNNVLVPTKNIQIQMHSSYQIWISKFRSGNFDLFDSYQSGRPTTNPYKTIEEPTLVDNQGTFGKINRVGVWVSYNLSEENKANHPSHARYCFKGINRIVFWSFEH